MGGSINMSERKFASTTIRDSEDTLGMTPEEVNKLLADTNTAVAKTEGFTKIGDVNFPEGLIFTSLIKLLDAGNNSDEMAGVSGIAGANKEYPAFWAGGTYAQAFGGTAKTILRHDGSGQLAGGNIRWNDTGSTEFLGGIKSPFTDISGATIESFWQEEITSWANNFFENQYTTSLAIRIIPCRNILNGQVFRIHALRRGIVLQPEETNGFYEDGTLLDEIQLIKGDAIEMVCICFDGVFHSWDIIRRYKCRPYDL